MASGSEELIGLIPAAGKGLRLALPYPKELYPIIRDNHYKPVSQFVVDSLVSSGIHQVIFVINETKHQLMGYFGDGHRFGCNFGYAVQEQTSNHNPSTSPGLAHALDSAYPWVKGKTVFFGMADTIMEPEDVFVRAWARAQSDDEVVLVLFETKRPEKFGMVRLDSANRVLEIVDKPARTDLTKMWGCMIWRSRFTDFLHRSVQEDGMTDFAKILNNGIAAGFPMRGILIEDGNYSDLGTYDEIMELDNNLRRHH